MKPSGISTRRELFESSFTKRKWTEEETSLLSKCTHFKEAVELSKQLNRSQRSCAAKYEQLLKAHVIQKSPLKTIFSWNEKELKRLENHKTLASAQNDSFLIKKRTLLAIGRMWYKIKARESSNKKIYRWTTNQTNILKTCPLKALPFTFPSLAPHTFEACRTKWYSLHRQF